MTCELEKRLIKDNRFHSFSFGYSKGQNVIREHWTCYLHTHDRVYTDYGFTKQEAYSKALSEYNKIENNSALNVLYPLVFIGLIVFIGSHIL